MKTKKYLLSFVAVCMILLLGACNDWGQMDAPAGNQVTPTLELVSHLNFDEELTPEEIQTFAYPGGDVPTLVQDEERGSVLHLEEGYARISNPLMNVKVQNGVSLTMWVKQLPVVEEETTSQDLTGALFSFQNQNHTQNMFFTANGWLSYDAADGEYEDNNPSTTKTGLLSVDEWHYVAICVHNDGYFVYVDGEKRIDLYSTHFDFAKIVQFMGSVPHLYLGYGSETQTAEWLVDDLKVYRNKITAKEWTRPGTGGGGEEENNYIGVGEEDCSTGWWSVFSPIVLASGDCEISYQFVNYTRGTNNWENWVLILTNGKAIGEEGCEELLILRADAFGWGAQYDAGVITHDYNFDTFKEDMQGATINMTIKRVGTHFEMTAITRKAGGGSCTYTFVSESFPTGTLGTQFTLEAAHLQIDRYQTTAGTLYKEGSNVVGLTDKTTPWWTEHFSDVVSANGDNLIKIKFKNYTNRAANWNNWVLITTNGYDIGSDGAAEYFVMRSDAYGWGDYMVLGNMTHTFNFDTFPADMDGATVHLTTKRVGERYDMNATIEKAAGGTMEYHYYHDEFPTTTMGNVLTIEGGYLDILSIATAPLINHK